MLCAHAHAHSLTYSLMRSRDGLGQNAPWPPSPPCRLRDGRRATCGMGYSSNRHYGAIETNDTGEQLTAIKRNSNRDVHVICLIHIRCWRGGNLIPPAASAGNYLMNRDEVNKKNYSVVQMHGLSAHVHRARCIHFARNDATAAACAIARWTPCRRARQAKFNCFHVHF